MTLNLLRELDDRRAFESTHRYEDLEFLHVRFDELTGRQETEHVLDQMAARQGRVAIVGPTGSGKSSAIASVLGPLVETLPDFIIPLRIPVAAETETVQDPRLFAQHIVRTVARYATETLTPEERKSLEAGVADTQRRRTRERTRRIALGAPRLVANIEFAAEAKSEAEEIEQRLGTGDIVAELARMIALFRAHQAEPFLVIDDSDGWVQIPGEDLSEIADAFFSRNVKMLAKELDCGFVVAVHDHYLTLDSYRETRALLSTEIRLPRFDPADAAIGRILNRRIELADVETEFEVLFDAEAIAQLVEIYESVGNLRRVLATVDRSVQHACSDGVAPVTRDLVLAALADLS